MPGQIQLTGATLQGGTWPGGYQEVSSPFCLMGFSQLLLQSGACQTEPCLVCHPQVLEFVAFRRRLQQSHSLALAQAEQACSAALQAAASPKDPVRRQALKPAWATAATLQVKLWLWLSEGT